MAIGKDNKVVTPTTVMAAKPAAKPVPARQAAKGTSYTATGLAQTSGGPPVNPPNYNEDGSSRPVRILDIVPELTSPYQRTVTYTRMMYDSSVDVSVRAVKTPVLGAEFFMEPYSSNPIDTMIAQFVNDNLFGGMTAPFSNSLEDILAFFEDGYSVIDKVYEDREWNPGTPNANARIYTMLKKLAPRPAPTIKQIDYDDNGGPVSITQSAIKADNSIEEVVIDISKCMVFTFNRKGGDLTGKSILRTAYPHWYYKTHFYKIDAIQKERHSLGVPHGKLMPGHSPRDREILRQMLRNIRSNEESFILTTPTVEVEFAEVKGNLVNVLESAVHHNAMILMNVMAQFLTLGVQAGGNSNAGGGRATAGSQVDMFMKSLRYVANYIADVINMYLIPELVVWNFPTNNFPKLKVRNIGETRDLQMLAAAIANLLAQGAITPDDPFEAWVRQTFDMPAQDPTTSRQSPSQQQQQNSNQNNNGAAGGNQPTNGASPQKGGVKPAKGTGTVGKPPNAATQVLEELGYELATETYPPFTPPPEPQPQNTEINVHTPPVEVSNSTPAPIVNIHTPNQEIKQIKPIAANVTKQEDGSTRVEYEYESD